MFSCTTSVARPRMSDATVPAPHVRPTSTPMTNNVMIPEPATRADMCNSTFDQDRPFQRRTTARHTSVMARR